MRGRKWGVFGALGAAGAAAITTIILATSSVAETAVLWVGAAGSCTRGTAATYNASSSCGSFDAANTAAALGDTVKVASGGYARQNVTTTLHSAGCDGTSLITFQPAAGASVTLGDTTHGGINVTTDCVKIKGMTIYGGGSEAASDANFDSGRPAYVTYQNDTIVQNFFLKGHHLTISGGSLGGYVACNVPGSGDNDGVSIEATSGGTPSDNITLSGVVFHDISDNAGGGTDCAGTSHSGVHVDCIQAYGADALTITGDTFYNCATSYALIKPDLSTTIKTLTITNNMGGANLSGGNGFLVGDASQNCGASTAINVSYNTFNGQGLQVGCVDSSGTGKIEGNVFVGAVGTCASSGFAGTVSYNVYGAGSNANCTGGTHAKTCAPTFLSPSSTTADWHLDPSDTCAKGAGNPGDYPTTDFDGTTRPLNTVDAGADEIQ